MSQEYYVAFDEFGEALDNGPNKERLENYEGATVIKAERTGNKINIDMEKYLEEFPDQREHIENGN